MRCARSVLLQPNRCSGHRRYTRTIVLVDQVEGNFQNDRPQLVWTVDLMQPVFHARIAAERGDGTGYTIDDVADGIVAKPVRAGWN